MRKAILITACSTLATVAPTFAQQSAPAALDPARRAIEVSLPEGGGGSMGFWWVRSPQTQIGLRVAAGYASHEPSPGTAQSTWNFSVGPAIKRHVLVSGPVVPHLRGSLLLGFAGADAPSRPRSLNVAGSGGFGVDWFPVDRVSIGAHTGIHTGFARTSAEAAGQRTTGRAWNFGTYTSGLTLHLYF